MDVEDAEAELEPGGEDLHQDGAHSDDPSPAPLGVVVLSECRGLGIETF